MAETRTPKQWQVERAHIKNLHSRFPRRITDGGRIIATVWQSDKRDIHARLIAKAPELAGSLARCSYLLERIHSGNYQALENATDAVAEARALLAELEP